MGHWTPTGIEPTDYDDDDDFPLRKTLKWKSFKVVCFWCTYTRSLEQYAYFLVLQTRTASTLHLHRLRVLRRNGCRQNGRPIRTKGMRTKWYWTKWYRQNGIRTKWYWTKWYGQNGTDKILRIKSSIIGVDLGCSPDPPIIEKRPCIYYFLPPLVPNISVCPHNIFDKSTPVHQSIPLPFRI